MKNIYIIILSLIISACQNQGQSPGSESSSSDYQKGGAPGKSAAVNLKGPTSSNVYTAPATFAYAADVKNFGTVSSVEFYLNGGLVGSDASAPYSFTLNNIAAGSYSVFARAKNSAGEVKDSSTVSIIVSGQVSNSLPQVQLTAPANNSSYLAPASFTLSASASDSDGSISEVAFYRDSVQASNLLGRDLTAPYSFSLSNLAPGSYSFLAVAKDNLGATKNSSIINVTVNENVLPPPPVSVPGLVASYSFDESSGSSVNDSAGANSGSLINGVLRGSGKVNGGLIFDGVNDYLNVPHSSSLNISGNQISLAMWLKFSSTGTWQSAIAKVNQDGSHMAPYFLYMLGVSNDNKPRFFLGLGGGSSFAEVRSPESMIEGQWYHIAGVYDGSKMRIYVNGVEKASNSASGNITSKTSSLRLGAGGTVNEVIKGSLDEVKIYSKALSASEVADLAGPVSQPDVIAPPSVQITGPGHASEFIAPASFTITAAASAPSGRTISEVAFFQGGTLLNRDQSAPYEIGVSNLAVGNYAFKAVVKDSSGAEATSSEVLVSVTSSLPVSNVIIPENRRMNWKPGVTVGVPGGIPNRSTICATIDAATYGTGLVDASVVIKNAVNSCPAGQVVFIPEGTYKLSARIATGMKNDVTIRGAGMGKTILKTEAAAEMIIIGSSDWPRPKNGISISSGALRNSSTVNVADSSSITVGKLVRLEQDDLPYVITKPNPTSNLSKMSAIFKVTAKTQTTVTVTPPIPFDFTNAPRLVPLALMVKGMGVEDLTLDANKLSGVPLQIEQAWGSWIKGVEIKNSTSRQVLALGLVASEIRENYTHDVTRGGMNTEGIDIVQDGSFNLIENNMIYNGGFPGIILGDGGGGCTGNVIGYNFVFSSNTGDPLVSGADISVSHGPHNMLNLVEGNIASGFLSDGYFGSTSHNTAFRNWFTATHPTANQNLIAVNIGTWNNYFNLVGNVLGSSSFSSTKGYYEPSHMFSYADQVIYKLGYPNLGNNGFSQTWGPTNPPDYTMQSYNQSGDKNLQERDLNVKATLIRHGNYDYLTKSTIWSPSISEQALAESMYYSGKPTWWPAGMAFPPIGPDRSPMTNMIPALQRYKNLNNGKSTP